MNVFLVIISSIIFLASFPMFTYAFVVPEQFAIALFSAGVLTASLAFAIPLVFLSRSNR
jgi:isoprenylcysteine carboxyl methyltransferase (ICMT) family protein YpbQ